MLMMDTKHTQQVEIAFKLIESNYKGFLRIDSSISCRMNIAENLSQRSSLNVSHFMQAHSLINEINK